MAKHNRQQIEPYIKSQIALLDNDPNGNLKIYDHFFESLSDTMFDKWFDDFLDGKEKLFFYMPNMKKNITNDKLFKIADKIGVKIFHRLVLKDKTGREYLTKHRYAVMRLPIRRVIQYLDKKYNMPVDDKHISALTGQVMEESKGGKMTLPQIRLMTSKGLDITVKEFVNLRGGNVEAYHEATSQMLEYGELSMDDIDTKQNARSVQVASSILKAMMLDNSI